MNINSPDYRALACKARHGISFSPERWGNDFTDQSREELAEDLEYLRTQTESGSVGNYEQKYTDKAVAYLHALSRCLSPMITGPANFPVARQEKAMDSERRRYEEWRNWRDKYIKRASSKRTLSPEAEIDKAMIDLEQAREHHLDLKAHPEKRSHSYSLTYARKKVKDLELKIKNMRIRIDRKKNWKPKYFEGGMIDIENDRVIIKHDEKPAADIITAMKRHGFRWSRKFESWSRKHTQNAIYDAMKIVGVA